MNKSEEMLVLCNENTINEADLPKGHFKVSKPFKIGFGAWSMSFRSGTILRYNGSKLEMWDPVEQIWRNRVPPISSATGLTLSRFGSGFDQKQQLNNFIKGTKSISKSQAEKEIQSATKEKIMNVKAAIKFLSGRQSSEKVKITFI